MSPRKVAECGTPSGYRRHRKNGEDACIACKAATAKYNRERNAILRGTGAQPRRRAVGVVTAAAPAPVLTGTLRVTLPAADALMAAKALAHYARTLRSTRASHIAGATAQASSAEHLRDDLLLALKALQGGRS